MKAVILNAGVSRRLLPYTKDTPKCLLNLGDMTIMDYQLSALDQVGIRDIVMVVGYRRDQIMEAARQRFPQMSYTFITNHRYEETNTAYSLWLAAEHFLDHDFVYLNGDVLFPPELLHRLVESHLPNALAVEIKTCGQEEVKVLTNGAGRIVDIGKELDQAEALGEFIGVARFSAAYSRPFFTALNSAVDAGMDMAYFEHALHETITRHELQLIDVTDIPCIEIDFPEDLFQAREKVKRMRV
ncbi:MAG: phosphocholine cytidylyltransferase family protein [Fidelibacterota bacterium]|nr:MAG: phosphocholine cytidylyltransferase family protein [Candidatus Neomarinimicrobiota bacterium]